MNDLTNKEKINIEDMIHEIRGKQVMLDSDLAKLYQCKNGTKEINQAVKNNINKFPIRFSWILSDIEYENLRSNFLTSSSRINYGGRRYNPRVFTEQGVAMLATILKSKIAVEISIAIMDAFVELRKYINDYDKRLSYTEQSIIKISNTLIEYDNKFDLIFSKLDKKSKINHIFFKGQIYDAYSLLVDILKESEEEIIIIDNYIDKSILDIISLLDKKVTIITNKYNNIDIEKYKSQYDNLKIKINNKIHDRFIIIDKKILYHCGASFKDLGNKCFAINKIEDNEILNQLLQKII